MTRSAEEWAHIDGEVRALLQQGLAVREVARRKECSYSYVRKRALQLGQRLYRGHQAAASHPWKTSPIGRRKCDGAELFNQQEEMEP